MARWAIVGGGILGSTLALRLSEQGAKVKLFEASTDLGGLASAWELGPVVWDRHYHVTLLSDAHTRGLLAELGLESEMEWVTTQTGVHSDGRLFPMSDSLDYLRYPQLSVVDKARLATTILYASRVRDWRSLEERPVEEWLRAWSGDDVFEKFWLPLLLAKLGSAYQTTSAAFIWATIQRLYAARRSGLKKEMFGYVPGGYSRILQALETALVDRGVDLALGVPVEEVARGPSVVAGGEIADFDHVVVTTEKNPSAYNGHLLLPRDWCPASHKTNKTASMRCHIKESSVPRF